MLYLCRRENINKMKQGYTYIMTNKRHNVLYTGCTSDIIKRVSQHKNHYFKGSFTDRYNCEYCIYFEDFPSISNAIKREKQIKNMSRNEKLALINKRNPEWKELVTENGFREKPMPWADQVKCVMDELIGSQHK